jgi:pimeloyl-ACP methyl ester carboxylesterase
MKKRAIIAAVLCLALPVMGLYIYNSGEDPRPAAGRSNLVRYDGITVQYYDRGEGDAVVLLPSLGRPASDFNELGDDLVKSGFRAVAVELRGVGKSGGEDSSRKLTQHQYADDVAEVIRRLDTLPGGRVHLVGHAYGNRIARTLATDHPELVKSVTLIAAGGYLPIPREIKMAMYLIFFNFLPDCIRKMFIGKAFFAPGNDIPEHWVRGWRFIAAWRQSRATFATLRDEWWSGGSSPILLLQGEQDVIAPAGNAVKMKGEFGDRVTLVMVPGAGHAMLPEQPGLIEGSIVAFLRRHRVQ